MKPDKSTRLPSHRSVLLMKIVGVVLILLAAYLYWGDLRIAQWRQRSTDVLRSIAHQAVLGMGIRATPASEAKVDATNLYEPCSAEVASNLLGRLALAEPAAVPNDRVFERSYDMFLFLTNRARVFLHVRRDLESDEAYVSISETRRKAKDSDDLVQFDSPASLVTGLRSILDEIDSGSPSSLREARKAGPAVPFTNLVRRAGVHGFTAETLASTAAGLRLVSTFPVRSIGLATDEASGNLKVLQPTQLEAFVRALASAKDTAFPEGEQDGDEYVLTMFFADGYMLQFRAVRLKAQPDALYLGFRDLEADSETGNVRLRISAPAILEGAGALLP